MKRYELLKLKKQLLQEIQRRKRINELLETELIQEFMMLGQVNVEALDAEDIRGMLSSILKHFTITETNGIYVCTGTYFTTFDICYEETSYYSQSVDFDSRLAEYRTYRDIENGSRISASMKKREDILRSKLSAAEFERKNIVLNPHNTSEKQNGYDEVREDFFMTAVEKGQGKAKKLILERYPRM